jgi:hypothetical protein
MAKRIKYNRADINSTVEAAMKLYNGKPLYIYGTPEGFAIAQTKPYFDRQYLKVEGKTVTHGGTW